MHRSHFFKAGLIAVGCLAFVYIFIAKIGADSVAAFGIQETGAPVLSNSAMILWQCRRGHPGCHRTPGLLVDLYRPDYVVRYVFQ